MPDDPAAPPPHDAAPSPGDLTSAQWTAIRKEVEAIIDREVNREVRLIQIALKIVVGIVVLLGIYTYGDLNRKVSRLVTDRVDTLIKQENSETSVRRTLDRLVNRTVVTAYLVASQASASMPGTKRLMMRHGSLGDKNLPYDEWTRLRRWIQDKKLAESDFSDAITVLGAQEDTRAKQDAEEILAEMLNPSARSAYRWMLDQSGKRLAILESFSQVGLGPAALDLALSQGNPKELRTAALVYIRKVNYKEAFSRLLPLAERADEDELNQQALYTCASLEPLGSKIGELVEKLLKPSAAGRTDSSIERLIKLADSIWRAPVRVTDNTAEQLKEKIADARVKITTTLLAHAFADKGAFVAEQPDGTFMIYVNSKYGPYAAFEAPREEFSQLTPYWNLLEDAAARGDIAALSWLAPRSALLTGLLALQVDLTGASCTIRSEAQLLRCPQVSQVVLRRTKDSEQRGQSTLEVLWTAGGQSHEGPLSALQGTHLRISLPKEPSNGT